MDIADNRVVSMRYTLRDTNGNVLEEVGDDGLEYLHGHGNIVPGLEETLEGESEGDTFDVTVPPEEAYGEHLDELVSRVDRDTFPEDKELEPGMVFQAVREDFGGEDASEFLVVRKIVGEEVEVDANHPLAGKTLSFDGEVLGVREARDEELEAGRPLAEESDGE
jgi:FKBP-type peptidyl-prolyl cis-trans isomerase SlyD